MNKFAVTKESNWQFSSFKFLHPTLEDAIIEAQRLSRQERGVFYVVELKAKCYASEIRTELL